MSGILSGPEPPPPPPPPKRPDYGKVAKAEREQAEQRSRAVTQDTNVYAGSLESGTASTKKQTLGS